MKAFIENDFWANLSQAEEGAEFLYMNAGELRAEAGMGAVSMGYDGHDGMVGVGQEEEAMAARLEAWVEGALASI